MKINDGPIRVAGHLSRNIGAREEFPRLKEIPDEGQP
jgi:hypothetical protein